MKIHPNHVDIICCNNAKTLTVPGNAGVLIGFFRCQHAIADEDVGAPKDCSPYPALHPDCGHFQLALKPPTLDEDTPEFFKIYKNDLVLCEINLEKHPQLDTVFRNSDINKINLELEPICGIHPEATNALLFLDEIQSAPHALPALRYYFEEKPSIPVIATGSLLEFTLSRANFSMPVGRVIYFHLFPLSFREFLHAISPDLLKYLDVISWSDRIPESAHLKLLEKHREYLFVGGMPEALAIYKKTSRSQLSRRCIVLSLTPIVMIFTSMPLKKKMLTSLVYQADLDYRRAPVDSDVVTDHNKNY